MPWSVNFTQALADALRGKCEVGTRNALRELADKVKKSSAPQDIGGGENSRGEWCFLLPGGYIIRCRIDEVNKLCTFLGITI